MAKTSKSISFKNACIDLDAMCISETTKDDYKEFNLRTILEEWNGIEGISLSIKKDDEIQSIDADTENEYDGEDE